MPLLQTPRWAQHVTWHGYWRLLEHRHAFGSRCPHIICAAIAGRVRTAPGTFRADLTIRPPYRDQLRHCRLRINFVADPLLLPFCSTDDCNSRRHIVQSDKFIWSIITTFYHVYLVFIPERLLPSAGSTSCSGRRRSAARNVADAPIPLAPILFRSSPSLFLRHCDRAVRIAGGRHWQAQLRQLKFPTGMAVSGARTAAGETDEDQAGGSAAAGLHQPQENNREESYNGPAEILRAAAVSCNVPHWRVS